MYKKEIGNLQTNFLLKIKHTLLKRMELEAMTKKYNNMLIDVLSELDYRRMNAN
jgi:hypothetical protein